MALFWERLAGTHNRALFASGAPELDFYLQRQAGQDRKRHLTAVYVLADDAGRIIGYYAMSQDSLTVEELPDAMGKKLPSKRKVPCTLLGRLAVDKNFHGRGYGREILYNALNRAAAMNQEIAFFAVIVDAKDQKAKEFYQRYNFVALKNQSMRLFMPMRDIEKLVKIWND